MKEITVNVSQKSGVIAIENFEEIRDYLEHQMEQYRGIQFTEETKTDAKKSIAQLRKLKDSLKGRVREVKKEYLEPFSTFEGKVSELYQLIDEPITEIDRQVKEFEKARLEEKRALIQSLYQEKVASVTDMLPLEKIYNPKWENATTSRKAIVTEMLERVNAVEKDLSVIQSMHSDYEEKAIARYRETLQLSDAISLMQIYERQEKEIREAEARKKAMLGQQEPQKENGAGKEEKREEEERDARKEARSESMTETFISPKAQEDSVVYQIYADPFQQVRIESFLRNNKIRFEKSRR